VSSSGQKKIFSVLFFVKKISNMSNNKIEIGHITNKTLKRSNTLGINNESGFGLRFISSKQLLFKDIKETEKPKKIYNHKSNKQLEIIAKFRYSLNAQLEKAKKINRKYKL